MLSGKLPRAWGSGEHWLWKSWGCDHFLLGTQKGCVLHCWLHLCVCVTSAYYHSGGHTISAFVYGCACGLESLNCVLLPCGALCQHIPPAAGLRFVTWCFVVLYRGDRTLRNTELEEFEYCLVAMSIFLLWIIVFVDHISIFFPP